MVSAFVDNTRSPGFMLSIPAKPVSMAISVPAIKHFMVPVIPPVNTANADTPVWNILYAVLECSLLFAWLIPSMPIFWLSFPVVGYLFYHIPS